MDMSYLTGKGNKKYLFYFLLKSFFYNLLRQKVFNSSQEKKYKVPDVSHRQRRLITMSSGNYRFPIGPHSLDEKALCQ